MLGIAAARARTMRASIALLMDIRPAISPWASAWTERGQETVANIACRQNRTRGYALCVHPGLTLSLFGSDVSVI